MSLLADKTIHKRVMSVVRSRIEKAQTDYEQGCIAHEEACETEIRAAEAKCETAKVGLADELVNGIVGKIL